MQVVFLPFTSPYQNLAAEEYFLKQCTQEYFLLWRNEPSIIVGRNQNTHKEINREYVKEHSLPVVRRLTGGGAVFHDLGNLNYTLIQQGMEDRFGDYRVFAQPVIDTLKALGVSASLSGRNDLLIGQKKFCGQAQTLWHGRLLHHGCMLFSSNMEALQQALRVNPLKIQSKGIDSVRSRVANLTDYLPKGVGVLEFAQQLERKFLENPNNTPYTLTPEDVAAIERLAQEKYQTYDWNFGFQKPFSFQKDSRFAGGIVTVSMNIVQDCIQELRVTGDFFGRTEITPLEQALVGVAYREDALLTALQAINLQDYMAGISPEELVSAMF